MEAAKRGCLGLLSFYFEKWGPVVNEWQKKLFHEVISYTNFLTTPAEKEEFAARLKTYHNLIPDLYYQACASGLKNVMGGLLVNLYQWKTDLKNNPILQFPDSNKFFRSDESSASNNNSRPAVLIDARRFDELVKEAWDEVTNDSLFSNTTTLPSLCMPTSTPAFIPIPSPGSVNSTIPASSISSSVPIPSVERLSPPPSFTDFFNQRKALPKPKAHKRKMSSKPRKSSSIRQKLNSINSL